MDRDLRLTVRSDPTLLGPIRSVVRSWLGAWNVEEETADQVVLAIDEACTNAIRHAYKGRCDGTVELTLHAEPEHLEFQVSDTGLSCPPECTERRPLSPPEVDGLEPGGLGIQLIHNIFDEVDFCPGEEGGNCVTMKLKRRK